MSIDCRVDMKYVQYRITHLQGRPIKIWHFTFAHIFASYQWISLANSMGNLRPFLGEGVFQRPFEEFFF